MHRVSEIEEFSGWPDPPDIDSAPVKKAIRLAWRRKFGNQCQSCWRLMYFEVRHRGHKMYATIDHIIARGSGGDNKKHNLQVICKMCNNNKSVKESSDALNR